MIPTNVFVASRWTSMHRNLMIQEICLAEFAAQYTLTMQNSEPTEDMAYPNDGNTMND